MIESLVLALMIGLPQSESKPAVVDHAAQATQDCRAVFEALRASAAGVGVIAADYLQTQTSLLFDEPMTASGKLFLRVDPPTLVMQAEQPVSVWIRTDRTSHQVWHRSKARAERFLYRENALADTMLQCLGSEFAAITAHFEVIEASRTPLADLVVLTPRDEEMRKRLTRLELRTLKVGERLELRSVAYTNAEGERTVLELQNVVHDPELESKDAFFSAELPREVELLTHDLRSKSNAPGK